jgi:hypothetical protein
MLRICATAKAQKQLYQQIIKEKLLIDLHNDNDCYVMKVISIISVHCQQFPQEYCIQSETFLLYIL